MALLVGLAAVIAVGVNTSRQGVRPAEIEAEEQADDVVAVDEAEGRQPEARAQPEPPPPPATDNAEAGEAPAEEAPAEEAPAQEAQAEGETEAPPGPEIDASESAPEPVTALTEDASFRARVWEDAVETPVLGALDPESAYRGQIEFTQRGAGIRSLKLAPYFESIEQAQHVELQRIRSIDRDGDGEDDLSAVPFAALSIEVGDTTIDVSRAGVWRPVPGASSAERVSFEALIETEAGGPVLRAVRTFTFEPGSYDLSIDRRLENLTDRPLTARLIETGPIDLPAPKTRYGGDKRRMRFGYLLKPEFQAGSPEVTADQELRGRGAILGKKEKDAQGFRRYEVEAPVWPNQRAKNKGHRLVWFALSGRYFAVAVHPEIDPVAAQRDPERKLFRSIDRIDRLVLNPYAELLDVTLVTRMTGAEVELPPGSAREQNIGVYAGPLLDEVFDAEPVAEALNLDGLIAYNFGGPCGEMCTFSWLTHLLLGLLRLYHGFTFDWAVAIVLLVLTVRTILHPVTRWSQTKLIRFGTEMQALGPKQQKLREKYKDDPKRMQEETAKLFREEGVNPAGALGCLPQFLQTPVWIALYATLYFAAEMRHEPGFYGVFQTISNGNWKFLGDLASPDQAIPLPAFMHFTPPLIGGIWGEVTSINALPILMGIVFFLHQKYLTPPTTGTMSPEQQQMQQTMKILFPIMLPLFLYPAPSGLAVYFITNSTLGIVESRWIRKGAEAKGYTDPEKLKSMKTQKRQAKGGGFMERLQQMAEEKQRQKAQQQAGGGAAGAAGKRRVQNTAQSRGTGGTPPQRKYKKRK